MVRLLLNLVASTVLVFALTRAVMPRGRRESVPQHLLRRAQWATVAFAVPIGYLLLLCVIAANPGGVPDRRGMIAYLFLAAVVAVAIPVLRSAWRAFRAARQGALDDTRRAAGLHVIEGADDLAPPHRGLSGEDPPPQRW